jgi:hypothetical protein
MLLLQRATALQAPAALAVNRNDMLLLLPTSFQPRLEAMRGQTNRFRSDWIVA